MSADRLALLIDADNISAEHYEAIAASMAKLGDTIVSKVFGDFASRRHADWLALCAERGLEPVLQLTNGRGRNATDIALTVAAMDLMAGGKVMGIAIASNDGDFVPLVQRLKAAGLSAHGFGNAHASKALRAIATSYTVIEGRKPVESGAFPFPTSAHLAPLAQSRQVSTAFSASPILDAVRRIMAESGPDGTMTLAAVGAALRKHAPALSETVAGKGRLRKLLMSTGRFEETGAGTDIRIRLKSA